MNAPEWLQAHRDFWDRTPEQDEQQEDYLTEHDQILSRGYQEEIVPDPLLKDVAFNRHSLNDGKHISPYDNNTVQIGVDRIQVKLVQGIDVQKFKQVLAMAQHATTGVSLDIPLPGEWEPCAEFGKAPQDSGHPAWGMFLNPLEGKKLTCHSSHRVRWEGKTIYEGQVKGDDWEEMLEGGLQSALESQVVVFAVSGVSRACTHQLVRSRKAAFHQQSQRATWYGDNPETRMPQSIWMHNNWLVREAYLNAVSAAHTAYQIACDNDVSYQDARYILPEGTTNYILCEYSVREFINVYAYRACSMFNWEIVHVVREMGRLLREAHPFLDKHIKISCEKTSGSKDFKDRAFGTGSNRGANAHTCTFQGWERVEEQCDFPWARDSNRQFRSAAHEIGGRKALTLHVAGIPGVATYVHWSRTEGMPPKHASFVDELTEDPSKVTCSNCMTLIALERSPGPVTASGLPVWVHYKPKEGLGLPHTYGKLRPSEVRSTTPDPARVTCSECVTYLTVEGP